MRKLLLSVTMLCLSAGLLSPVAAGPGAGAYHEQIAYASWIDMHGKTGDFTGAFAMRYLEDELVTLGLVFKGKCRTQGDDHFVLIYCSGRGVGREIPLEDFEMHPLMDSATLKLKGRGFSNRVTWTGRGDGPVGSGGVVGGDKWVAAGADMSRDAKTKGKVFGKSYRSKGWLDFGFMIASTGAVAIADVDDYDTESLDIDQNRDGTFTIHQTFRIPR